MVSEGGRTHGSPSRQRKCQIFLDLTPIPLSWFVLSTTPNSVSKVRTDPFSRFLGTSCERDRVRSPRSELIVQRWESGRSNVTVAPRTLAGSVRRIAAIRTPAIDGPSPANCGHHFEQSHGAAGLCLRKWKGRRHCSLTHQEMLIFRIMMGLELLQPVAIDTLKTRIRNSVENA